MKAAVARPSAGHGGPLVAMATHKASARVPSPGRERRSRETWCGAARRGRGGRGPFQTGGRWAAARHEMAESDRAEAAAPRRAEEAAGQAPQPPSQQQQQPAPQQQTPQQPPQDEEAAAAAAPGSGAGNANGVKMCVRAGPGGRRGQRGRGCGGRRWPGPPAPMAPPPRGRGTAGAGAAGTPPAPAARGGRGLGTGPVAVLGQRPLRAGRCEAAPRGRAGLRAPGSATWRTGSHGILFQECSASLLVPFRFPFLAETMLFVKVELVFVYVRMVREPYGNLLRKNKPRTCMHEVFLETVTFSYREYVNLCFE